MTAQAGARTDAAFAGLDEDTAYTLYAALADAAGNLALASAAVRTADATAPSAVAVVAVASSRSATLSLVLDEDADVWFLAGTGAMEAGDVVAHPLAARRAAMAGEPLAHTFSGLDEGVAYTLYAALADAAGNLALAMTSVTTDDASAPDLSVSAEAGATTATLRWLSSEGGLGHLWVSEDARRTAEPDADYVVARAVADGRTATVTAHAPGSEALSALGERTAYTLYLAVRDAAGNTALASVRTVTGDATPPAVTAVLAEAGATTAALRFHAGEPGRAWLLASTESALGAAEVMASASAVAGVAPGTLHRHVFSGLAEATAYTLYAAVADAAGNVGVGSTTVTTRDATPPDVVALSASAGASTAALSFWSGEAGEAYLWADRRAGLAAAEVRTLARARGQALAVAMDSTHARTFAGLDEDTAYTLYAALADAAGNLALASAAVRTADATAPSAVAVVAVASSRSATLSLVLDEDADVWFLAGTGAMEAGDVVAHPLAARRAAMAGEPLAHTFSGLDEGVAYTLYAALADAAGNLALAMTSVTTDDASAPDLSVSAEAGATTATLRWLSSEGGLGHLWVSEDARRTAEPDADYVVARAVADGRTATVTAHAPGSEALSALGERTAYTLYLAVRDAAGNTALASVRTVTGDATPPAVTAVLAEAGATTAALRFHAGEPGRAWLLASTDGALGAAEVMASASAVAGVAPGALHRHVFSGLAEATAYTLYAAVADAAGNVALAMATVTTRDATPPDVVALSASAGASTAALSFWSGEAGEAYLWADRRAGLAAAEVRTLARARGQALAVAMDSTHARTFAGLDEDTAYTLYAALADAAGNLALASAAVRTADATAPSAVAVVAVASSRSATLSLVLDEDADVWFLAGTGAMEAGDVVAHPLAARRAAMAGEPLAHTFSGLDEGVAYTLYAALADAAGNLALAMTSVTTDDASAPDLSVSAEAGATTATLRWLSSEGGLGHLWVSEDARRTAEPDADYVVARAVADGRTATVTAHAPGSEALSALGERTAYTLYLAVRDAAGNTALASVRTVTGDATPPAVTAVLAEAGATTAALRFHAGEPGRAWLLASTESALGAAEVMASASAVAGVAPGALHRHVFSGLAEATAYTLYAAVADAAGNVAVGSATVTTRDATPPDVVALSASAGASTAALSFWSGEAGEAYLWADRRAGLAAAEVRTLARARGQALAVAMDSTHARTFAGLDEDTAYTLYAALADAAGNLALASAAVRTADATAPSAVAVVAVASSRSATLSLVLDEDADVWFLAGTGAMEAGDVVAHPLAARRAAMAGEPLAHTFSGLDEGVAYTLYAALADAAGNLALAMTSVTTDDASAPDLSVSAEAGATTATLRWLSSEGGLGHLWVSEDARRTAEPDADYVVARAVADGRTATVTAHAPGSEALSALGERTAYTLYLAVRDAAGNTALASVRTVTGDATPPAVTAVLAEAGATTAALRFHAGEPGRAWLLASTESALGAAEVMASASAVAGVAPGTLHRHVFSGLAEATAYTLYAAVADAAGNVGVGSATVTTRDATPPDVVALSASAGASTAALSFWSGEAGEAYLWADRRAGLAAAEVRTLARARGQALAVAMDSTHARTFAGLDEDTAYTLYAALADAAGNLALASAAVRTADATAPSAVAVVAVASSRSATLSLVLDEDADVWFLAFLNPPPPSGPLTPPPGDPPPPLQPPAPSTVVVTWIQARPALTPAQVRAHSGVAERAAKAGEPLAHTFSGLDEGVAYTLYAVFADAAGNEDILAAAVRTADASAPRLSVSAEAGATTATLIWLSSEGGAGHLWADRRAGLGIETVVANAMAAGQTAAVTAHALGSHTFPALAENADHTLYLVVSDDEGNQAIASVAVTTRDATAPDIAVVSVEPGASTAALIFRSAEGGVVWLLADERGKLSALEARALADVTGQTANVGAQGAGRHVFSGLAEATAYTFYAVIADTAGNLALASTRTMTRDATPPDVVALSASAGASTAALSFWSGEAGEAYLWADRRAGLAAAEVRTLARARGQALAVAMDSTHARTFAGLDEDTAYTLYAALADAAGNLALASAAVRTADATAPSAVAVVAVASSRSATLSLVLDEDADVWFLAGTGAMEAGDVVAHPLAARRAAMAGEPLAHTFSGLDEGVAYTLYAALADAAGNLALAMTSVTTDDASAPDLSVSAEAGATTATLRWLSSEGGLGHLWVSEDARRTAEPDADYVVARAVADGRTATVTAHAPGSEALSALGERTAYTLYLAVRDAAGNTALASVRTVTGDATPPAVTAVLAEAGATTAALRFHAGEPGRAWLLASTESALGAAEVMASASAVAGVAPGALHRHVFSGLAEATAYTLYAAVADAAGNVALAMATVTTRDATPPDVVALSASAGASTAALSFWSASGGVAWLLADPRPGLGALQVRRAAGASSMTAQAGARTDAAFAGLDEDTAYTLYAALADAAGNLALASAAVRTADATAPSAVAVVAVASSRSATLSLVLDEDADVWFLAFLNPPPPSGPLTPPPGDPPPPLQPPAPSTVVVTWIQARPALTPAQVRAHSGVAERAAKAGEPLAHTFSGLDEGVAYTLYAVFADAAGNEDILAAAVRTADASAPRLSVSAEAGATTATLIWLSSEGGAGHLWADRRAGLGIETVVANAMAAGQTAAVTAHALGSHTFPALAENADHTLYLVVSDDEGNQAIASVAVTTRDATAPSAIAVVAVASSRSATLSLVLDEDADVWFLAFLNPPPPSGPLTPPPGDPPPPLQPPAPSTVVVTWIQARPALTPAQVRAHSGVAERAAKAGEPLAHTFSGLDEGVAYTLYAVFADAAGNEDILAAAVRTADASAPRLSVSAEAGATTATLIWLSSEGGAGHLWADRRAGLGIETVVANAMAAGQTAAVTAHALGSHTFPALAENADHTLYLVVSDDEGNQAIASVAVTTRDATAPSAIAVVAVASSRSATLSVVLDEDARVWLLATPEAAASNQIPVTSPLASRAWTPVMPAFTADQLRAHHGATMVRVVARELLVHRFTSLDEDTVYTLQVAFADADENAGIVAGTVRTADTGAPSLSLSAIAGASTATLDYLSSEAGVGYLWASRDPGLDADYVEAHAAMAKQTATVVAGVPARHVFTGLVESTAYTLYLVVRDNANNPATASVTITTRDATPATLEILAAQASTNTATLRFRASEDADIWLWADVQTDLEAQGILLRAGVPATVSVLAGAENTSVLDGLTENTAYTLYIVARDGGGNLSVAQTATRTGDGTPPVVEIFAVAVGATTASVRFAPRDEDLAVWLLADPDPGLVADIVIARVGMPTLPVVGVNQTTEHRFTGLSEETTYTLYITAEDAAGQRAVFRRAIHTRDASAPTISNLLVEASTDSVSVTFQTGEDDGTFFSLLDPSISATLSLAEVAIRTLGAERALARDNYVRLAGLPQNTDYALYLLLVDVANNSTMHRIVVRTQDSVAPALTLQKLIVSDSTVGVTLRADEDSMARLSISDLDYPGSRSLQGTLAMRRGQPATYVYNGLEADTAYVLHIDAVDAAGNVSEAITRTVVMPPERRTLEAVAAVVNVASGRQVARLPIGELVRTSATESGRPFALRACYAPAATLDCPPLPVEGAGDAMLLRPGSHAIVWILGHEHNGTTTTVSVTQTINVLPRVAWQPEASYSVGSAMVVRATLNGALVDPSRPLAVPFLVYEDRADGDMQGSEHMLVFDGLQGSATLPASAGSGQLKLRFASERAPFAQNHRQIDDLTVDRVVVGENIRQTMHVVAGNLPPVVSLRISRLDGSPGAGVVLRGEHLRLALRVSDPNGNALTLRCASSLTIPSLEALCDETLHPETVALSSTLLASADGYHQIWVEADDGALRTRRSVQLPVVAADPRAADADTDRDGVPDRREGLGDADGDFVPDYLDALEHNGSAMALRRTGDPTAYAIQAPEWASLQLGEAVFSALDDAPGAERNAFVPLVPIEALRVRYGPHAGNGDDLPTPTHGLFSFALSGLDPGERVSVVLAALQGLPERPRFRVFIRATGWETFSTASGDSATSLRSASGHCPDDDDQRWDGAGTLSGGQRCMRLSIADGGPNDSDGRADGTVQVIGGPVTYTGAQEVAVGSPIDGGCALASGQRPASAPLSGLLILALAAFWRRRRALGTRSSR